jgi:tryptophan-rich sensory protein
MKNERTILQAATPFVVSIGIALLAGAIGSLFTASGLESWYDQLVKPELNPPSWVFGPVWTLLYVLIAVAAALVYRAPKSRIRTIALAIYAVQLMLNSLWSILFFGLQNPLFALIEIAILWLFIALTIVLFWRINKIAALLLLPYLLWVSFASYLNGSIYLLN